MQWSFSNTVAQSLFTWRRKSGGNSSTLNVFRAADAADTAVNVAEGRGGCSELVHSVASLITLRDDGVRLPLVSIYVATSPG
jgi:hypothetical protein